MGFDYRAIYQLPGEGSIDLGESPSRTIQEALCTFMEKGVDYGSLKVDENVITELEAYLDTVTDELKALEESIDEMDYGFQRFTAEGRTIACRQDNLLYFHDFLIRVVQAARTANRYPGHQVVIHYS
jgi:regulator of sigma D